MQDRPTAEQLLEAVAAFLREQVVPSTRGPLAFHARVAANALDIARREGALAPAADARERGLLAALLGADASHDAARLNRLLCERIDADAMDLQTPGLADALWQITLDKLAVDQPGYDTYQRAVAAGR
ncbi:MAG TPA: DUF6285 domain-containing protein [Burkholderiaceae bacterium]|nr:DUF6285 domain-containing protein [Burkholderiaceae bacterium]